MSGWSLHEGLLEREVVLGAIGDGLRTVEHGSGAVVFVSGPAGIGKTSALEAGRRAAIQSGFRVGSGVGSPMETGLPFGLIGQAVVALGGSPDVDVVQLERLGGQSARLYGMFRWLRAVAARTPLLLALDDLHWADPDSLDLLGFLCRRLAGCRIVVLGCLRPEPDPAWVLARDLVGSGHASTVSLGPLSQEASLALIEQVAPKALDREQRARVLSVCAGTPLLLKAAASTLAAGGSLPAFPATFGASLMLERFAGVGEDAMAYVRAASILGVRFRPALAGALASLDEAVWETEHGRLVRAGLLDDHGGGWAAFVHPLFAHALLESCPRSERERAHARAFRLLVARREPHAVAAEHALAARLFGDSHAVEVTARAGREALAQGALDVACAHLANAVELAGDMPDAELLLDYASAVASRARIEEAEEVGGRVLLQSELDQGLRARTLALLARTAMLAGRPEDAERRCEQAAAAGALVDPSLEAVALVDAVMACSFTSPLTWTFATLSRALAILPPDAPARRPLEFLSALTRLEGGDPSGEELLASEARSWQSGDDNDDPSLAMAMAVWSQASLRLLEDLEGWTEVFEREFEQAVEAGAPVTAMTLAVVYSDALVRMGRPAEALELVQRTLAFSDWSMTPWSDLALARALTELGRDEDARPHIETLRSLTAQVPAQYYAIVSLWLVMLDGRRLLAAGESERASEAMLHAAQLTRRTGWRHPLIVPWAGVAIDAHLAAGRVDRAGDLIEDLEQLSHRLTCHWPQAVAMLGRARLEGLNGPADEADEQFEHALATFAELPFPIFYAEALITYGSYLRRGGRLREARAPLARALELSEKADAERVARLARAELAAAGGRRRRRASDADQLTAQEKRIAALAAQGLTNAQIGAAVHLSPKTVGHYLERVYDKLSINSRRELIRQPGKLK